MANDANPAFVSDRGRRKENVRRNKPANVRNQKARPKKKPVAKVVEVAPIAPAAKMRGRHWGLLLGFLIFAVIPMALTAFYLWTRAADQYASTVGFTVRQEGGANASDLLGGIAATMSTSSGQGDTDILYEYIQSQHLVAAVDKKFDLRTAYSAAREQDPYFTIKPDASIEDLVAYWPNVVRISYDQATRLIELRVLAFEPQMAQGIAIEIVAQSQELINELNAQARSDTIRYAEDDLVEAQARLKVAREALVLFRTRTQIVDPETDLQGRMGVVNTLQQQLAEALIEFDLLLETTATSDPRMQQARQRIEVIRDRIAEERAAVAAGADNVSGQDYPTLLALYESLVVDREFAEKSYTAALAALDAARADAQRQSRYLATYVAPTYPETSEYPRRMTLFGLTSLFLILVWSIVALVFYSIRDSR